MKNPPPSSLGSLDELERKREDLAVLAGRLAPHEGDNATLLPSLSVHRASRPTQASHAIYASMLTVVAQGGKEVVVGEQTYRYDQANYLLTSVDMPVLARVTDATPARPCLCVAWRLDAARITDLMAAHPPPSKAPPRCGMFVSPLSFEPLDAVLRLVRLLEQPDDLPILAPLIERELLYRLMTGEQGGVLRQIALSGSQSHQVARAIDWLKQNYRAPLRIQELAQTVNMSVSSLHHHFKAVTALSPLQYQKALRLQEARRLLLAEYCDAASAAHRVGYESPSQFSREYSRFFGAPPLRDISQLRNGGGADDMAAGAGSALRI